MREFDKLSSYIDLSDTYSDAIIEFESGKKVSLKDVDDLQIKKDGESVFITTVFDGYKAEFSTTCAGENIFSYKAELTPVGVILDKVHKITTLKFAAPYNENTRMLINHSFKEGVLSVNELPKNCCCENFCTFYQLDRVNYAITVATKIPAKFKSDIEISRDDNSFTLSASTIIPYSYEGKIMCQEWKLYLGMSVADAIMKNVEVSSSSNPFPNPIGWSTWDYYFTSATEDDVKENVDFIACDRVLSNKVKYIAIDDGWQQREGDWRSGIRYPGGLKSLVDYIKDKGFEAGIWIAPTRLHFLCGTVMRRNDFLVRDKYGDPVMDEDMYVLDPTHPDGEVFLRETFTYLAKCGFTFYKLDFISNMITCAERFYDKNAGPFDALARLIQIVRETVPAGSHVMGCSLPYAMGADVVDSRRTGWDIHNVWGHVKLCTATYIPQFAANGKIYRNDLDYLVVRGADTSSDTATNVLNDKKGYNATNLTDGFVWRKGTDFNYTEAKTWCNVILMAGSSVFLGDKLPLLNEKGVNLVRKTVDSADFCAAIPVFENEIIPEIWYKPSMQKLYVFNFSDEIKDYVIKLEDLMLRTDVTYTELFTEQEYKPENDVLIFSLNPHDSVCLGGTKVTPL